MLDKVKGRTFMAVGLVILELKIPCAPEDDPRVRITRTLRSALVLLEKTKPADSLPLEGTLRDDVGLNGMYKMIYNP